MCRASAHCPHKGEEGNFLGHLQACAPAPALPSGHAIVHLRANPSKHARARVAACNTCSSHPRCAAILDLDLCWKRSCAVGGSRRTGSSVRLSSVLSTASARHTGKLCRGTRATAPKRLPLPEPAPPAHIRRPHHASTPVQHSLRRSRARSRARVLQLYGPARIREIFTKDFRREIESMNSSELSDSDIHTARRNAGAVASAQLL